MPATASLTPDALLRDMANLWLTLGQRGQIESGEGVLRACSMTLIVLAEETDDFQALGETLAALMPQHPARVIIVRLQSAREARLAGRVFAQCWMPFGQRRQICCEQIEIGAPNAALSDALAVIDAITAPDLPAIVWCRTLPLLQKPEFHEVLKHATRVIVDTAAAADPRSAMARLAEIAAGGSRLGDLSWTRLTRWREMISQLFENRERLARLRGEVAVRVESGGTAAPAQARYLGAWLEDSIRAAGSACAVKLESMPSAPSGKLNRVELSSKELRIELTSGDSRIEMTVDGVAHCVSLPPQTDYSLMREELDIIRPDPVFERALDSAKRL